MKIKSSTVVGLALVVGLFALTGAFYDRLPESTPTHWSARGEADGFTAKPWGPFILPLITLGVWLVMMIVPHISPKGFRVERFQRVYDVIQLVVVAFFFFLGGMGLLVGLGVPVSMNTGIELGTGLLFMVLGNFMGKITRNFFVGIRVPWTLASEEVWLRTHRLGGKLFVLAGAVTVLSALLGWGTSPMIVAMMLAVSITLVYSFVIYRRLEGFKEEAGR